MCNDKIFTHACPEDVIVVRAVSPLFHLNCRGGTPSTGLLLDAPHTPLHNYSVEGESDRLYRFSHPLLISEGGVSRVAWSVPRPTPVDRKWDRD